MIEQLWAALHVQDVAANAAYYAEKLGWRLDRHDPDEDLAYVVDADGFAIVLLGPKAGDAGAHLSESLAVFQPGQTIRVPGGDLDTQRAALLARGLADVRITDASWGDRILHVPAPEGYTWHFVTPAPLSPEETLALYAGGPDALEAALAELPEQDRDHQPAPDAWSIRQIAHHIVDGDDLWAMPIKAALAASGSIFDQDWYSTDNASAQTLDYADLSLDPAIALYRAQRTYIVALVRHLPDAWERHIMFTRAGAPEPRKLTVEQMLRAQARHALEHVEEIRALRRQYEGQ